MDCFVSDHVSWSCALLDVVPHFQNRIGDNRFIGVSIRQKQFLLGVCVAKLFPE